MNLIVFKWLAIEQVFFAKPIEAFLAIIEKDASQLTNLMITGVINTL